MSSGINVVSTVRTTLLWCCSWMLIGMFTGIAPCAAGPHEDGLKLLHEADSAFTHDQAELVHERCIQALELAKRNNDSTLTADCYQHLGQYFLMKGNNLLAFEYYRKAKILSELLHDSLILTNSLFFLGVVSYSANDFREGNEFFSQVLPMLDAVKQERKYHTTLYLLGLCKTELGVYASADSMLKKALTHFRDTRDSSRMYECSTGILQLLVRQGQMQQAESLYTVMTAQNNTYLFNIGSWMEYEMSYLYEQAGDVKAALRHGEASRNYMIGKTIGLFMRLKLNRLLSRLYEKNNQPEQALYYFKEASADLDSLKSTEMAKRMESMKMETELRSKETEIDLLNSRVQVNELARRNYIIVISSLLFFLLLLGLFLNSRTKLTRQLRDRNERLADANKKSDDLLLNILPKEVADELKEQGYSEARLYPAVSVMFTDFVNFTGISQQLTPNELVAEIHRIFTAFDHIMEKHGVEKIKTIGDAYMAVTGMPVEDPDHAVNMVRAAEELLSWMQESGSRFMIRVGIHSGPVVAGIVGVKKYAYDIWGDTVNTAARMEQNSESGKINISGDTYALIQDQITCRHRGKIAAKNKGEIDMYFVEAG